MFTPEKIIDCGVDYLTTTTTEPERARLLLVQADSLISQERRRGFFVKGWSMSGYSGYACGRVQAGERPDGAIVRLSSDMAESHWWQLFQTTGRASRIDIQVTCRMNDNPALNVLRLSEDAHRYYCGRKDGPRLTLWTDNNDGATLYVGSRSSDYYFRAYNKESESSLEEYERCVRLELEVKHRASVPLINWLSDGESVHDRIKDRIAGYMDQHGILHNLADCSSGFACESQSRAPDCLKSLAWLRTQVKPTVQRLLECNMENAVRDALGLS